MKTTFLQLLIVTVVMTTSFAAYATPTWAAINTDAYGSNTGADNAANYTAYFCTAKAAADEFGSSSVASLTAYFKQSEGFADGESWLTDNATALSGASWSDEAEYYTFFSTGAVTLSDDDYVGFVLFGSGAEGDRAIRIFGKGNAELGISNSYLAFDAENTDAGAWTTVTVPEPTSALLLLFGLTGLALKRKQM